MEGFAWLLELTSVLIVSLVAVEFYVKTYQHDRSDIAIEPDSDEPSNVRQKAPNAWGTYSFEHALSVSNSGTRTAIISRPTVTSISLLTDEPSDRISLTDCPVRSSLRTGELPDGNRIPADHSGLLKIRHDIVDTDSFCDHLGSNSRFDVEFEIPLSDNKGTRTITVTEQIPLYGSKSGTPR